MIGGSNSDGIAASNLDVRGLLISFWKDNRDFEAAFIAVTSAWKTNLLPTHRQGISSVGQYTPPSNVYTYSDFGYF